MRFKRYWLLALLLVVTTDTSIAQQQRWVSLNQCVDQLLLRWAPQQLVGITYLSAGEPLLKTTAAHVTAHNGTLESILALQPSRVIATAFTDPRLVKQLREYTQVTRLAQPQSWADYKRWRQQLIELGLEEQVSQHAAKTRVQLARLKSQPQQVVFVMPNQWSWGEGSWADTLINQAGWQNLSAAEGSGLVALQLEQLLQWQPDTVILEGFSENSFALANNWRHHPLLKQWLQQQRVTVIDSGKAACPVVNIGLYLDALEQVQQQRVSHDPTT